MSESAPWRALEEAPGVAGSGAGPPASTATGAGPASGPGLLRPWAMAGLGLAVLLMVAAGLLVATSGSGAVAVEGGTALRSTEVRSSGGPGQSTNQELIVDVQGAVLRPGVVRLAPGSRVGDAIEAAGGYGPRVAADRVGQALNLAAELRDGDKVVVPSRDDPGAPSADGPAGGGNGSTGSGGSGGSGAGGGPVNLNAATSAELDALPGIGPVTAAKIIAAREEQPFASLEDLRTRKVLGAATLEKIKDLVVVR
jgi:competence protein ComEA